MATKYGVPGSEGLRAQFAPLQRKVNGKDLVYLDSAATSLTPSCVTDAILDYYQNSNANIHRGVHKMAEEATLKYWEAHERVAKLIGAKAAEEIVFSKNTTESLNLLAYTLTKDLGKDDAVVISIMEHHANFVPWQQLSKERGFELRIIGLRSDHTLDMEQLEGAMDKRVKVVAVTHVSNVLGIINPIKEISRLAHAVGAFVVVDGAQAIPHLPVNVMELGCDFYAFSAHKMMGPTGLGIMWGRKKLLEDMDPFLYGGDMIKEVTTMGSKWNDLPWKFEAGTPPIAESYGLIAGIDFLETVGLDNIHEHDLKIGGYLKRKLQEIEGITLYGASACGQAGIVAFSVEGAHPHDLASLLDADGVAIRAGHHCAQPLVNALGQHALCRASVYAYTTEGEIDAFIVALKKAIKVFVK